MCVLLQCEDELEPLRRASLDTQLNERRQTKPGPARPSLSLRAKLRFTGVDAVDSLIAGALDHCLHLRRLDRFYHGLPQDESGRGFAQHALSGLNIGCDLSATNLHNVPIAGASIIVANHPFGGVDGLLLLKLVLQRREDVRILANTHLSQISDLRDWMIGVNPFEGASATKQNLLPLRQAFRWLQRGGALITFPSGEVSHYQISRNRIEDPEWNPSVVQLALRCDATVTPAFVAGKNSLLFQILGCIHPRLRTAMLAREFLNKRDKNIELRFGPRVEPARLKRFASPLESAKYLRLRTYLLGDVHRCGREESQPDQSRAPGHTDLPCSAGILAAELERLPAGQSLLTHGNFEVVYATAAQIPLGLKEIGQLRERTFRQVGEGTGKSADLDEFDEHYSHLVLWDHRREVIAGAYRFAFVDKVLERQGEQGLYTYTLFRYKRHFIDTLGDAVELGRSFVRLEYQRQPLPLFLLWRSIGRLIAREPRYHLLFGAVSISNDYHPLSRQFMVDFLRMHNYASELARYVRPRTGVRQAERTCWSRGQLSVLQDIDAASECVDSIETHKRGIPVLLRQYLRLGGTLLGFNLDQEFGDALDGLILVDLRKTEHRILERYMGKEETRGFLSHHARKLPSVREAS